MSARRTSHNTIANDAASVPSFDKLTPYPIQAKDPHSIGWARTMVTKKTFSVQSSAHDARGTAIRRQSAALCLQCFESQPIHRARKTPPSNGKSVSNGTKPERYTPRPAAPYPLMYSNIRGG